MTGDCPTWAEISAKAAPLLCPVCQDDDHMFSDDAGQWTCHTCGAEFVTARWIRWMETQVPKGYYVETYGGGRYTSIGFYGSEKDAEAEVIRIMLVTAWSGRSPRVTPCYGD